VSPQSIFISWLLLLSQTSGSPAYTAQEEDNYVYEDVNEVEEESRAEEETAVSGTPKFVTQAESVLVNEGETLRLPCFVDRLEGFVMLWKKNGDIITVANQIIDKRVRLEQEKKGNYLVISQSGPEDGGEYTCQISAFYPTELTHTVRIRTKPVIYSQQEVVKQRAGTKASLKCRAEGSPAPTLVWRKDGEAQDLDSVAGLLTFESLNRHQSGTYTCLADNGFGPQPVSKSVKLEVEYGPHITVENKDVDTDFRDTKELVCTVHAHPRAKVTWLKDGQPIDSSMEDMSVTREKHRHSLTLVAVTTDKLGQYQCKAENDIGQAMKTVTLKGHASPAVMLSPTESDYTSQYTLKWRASSISDIDMFRIEVQKDGQDTWEVHEVEELIEKIEDNETLDGETKKSLSPYHGSLTLEKLEPATRYKARVSSRNAFGFNSPEEVFNFATKGDPFHQPSVLTAGSSVPHAEATLLLLLVTLTMVVLDL